MNTDSIICYANASEWHADAPHLAVPVTEWDHVIGDPDAPVTLVQYGDYECASCVDAEPIVKELLQLHGERLRVVFRHFPQHSSLPQASLAAQAAEAAGAQGKFWEMHDLLFRNRGKLADEEMTHLALTAGLEIYRFSAELASGTHEDRVREHFVGGIRSGVNQTPTFFVNGERIAGPRGVKVLSDAVERSLQLHVWP